MNRELVKNGSQDLFGRPATARQSVIALRQHLRLDDRNETGPLTKGGVTGKRVRIGVDAGASWESFAQADYRPPLGEPRAHFEIIPKAFPQSVEPLGDLFASVSDEILGTRIDLDAGKDA